MQLEHFTEIREIDDQHEEIHEVTSQLVQAVETGDKWHIVHYILVRLHELLRFHFSVEESVMRIVEFPDVEEHKKLHREYLDKIEYLKDVSLKSENMSSEEISAQQVSFLEHILDHDKKFIEFVRASRR